jgi:hypothetical protein
MLSDVQSLLSELARMPSVICTVGSHDAIGELFLGEPPQKIEFNGNWAAIECKGWHLHVNLAGVTRVHFVEEAGHEQSISPVAIFEDAQGRSVLRFYFPHASHTHTTYTAEELALFDRCKRQHQNRLETRG